MDAKIISARQAVDKYRADHLLLTAEPGKAIDHSGIFKALTEALAKEGYTLENFFKASEEANAKELGYKSLADFQAKATTQDKLTLKGMWK